MSYYSLFNTISIGGIFSLLALGLYISFRVVRFPDLTCDGSYALGACTTAALLHCGLPAFWSVVMGMTAGFVAGFLTGTMYSKLRFPHVVSGIIVMTAAYSINLITMGVPNLSIKVEMSLFSPLEAWLRRSQDADSLLPSLTYASLILFFGAIAYLIIWRFLICEYGLRLRCVGIDARMAERNGIKTALYIPLALGLANALVGLAGGLFAHYQRFADVNMGFGIIMVGLASVFLGQAFETIGIRRPFPGIGLQMVSVFIGALVYRILVSTAYDLGLPTSVFNLVTAGLVFLALLSPGIRTQWVKTFTRE